jgi:hypothetical protein
LIVDLTNSAGTKRLGVLFGHLNRAVVCNSEVKHVHPVGAGRKTQLYALLAPDPPPGAFLAYLPVQFEGVGFGSAT